MMDVNAVVWVIIIATAIISYKGFNDQAFFNKNMFYVEAIKNRKEYFRLITSGFLHADLMHIIFNMLTLFFFSGLVVAGFGVWGYLIIYLGSIVVGNLFSLYIYKNQPSYRAIGASGGVSGILFAAIAMDPFMGIGFIFIPIPIPGYIFGALYFAYTVYMMLNPKQWDNLGHAAHLGGAALGLVYALVAYPQLVVAHALQLLIMSLPLIYLGVRIASKKGIH